MNRMLTHYGLVVVLGVDSTVVRGGVVIGTVGQVRQLQGGQAVCVCVGGGGCMTSHDCACSHWLTMRGSCYHNIITPCMTQ